jgi:hypothetical protein
MMAAFTLLISISAGCGNSGNEGPSLQDIPRYPNAIEGESMAGSSLGGIVSGSLVQFTTADAFDAVVAFYSDALAEYDLEFISNESARGRQTAISIPKKNGIVSVAIQEFTEKEEVNITFMEASS